LKQRQLLVIAPYDVTVQNNREHGADEQPLVYVSTERAFAAACVSVKEQEIVFIGADERNNFEKLMILEGAVTRVDELFSKGTAVIFVVVPIDYLETFYAEVSPDKSGYGNCVTDQAYEIVIERYPEHDKFNYRHVFQVFAVGRIRYLAQTLPLGNPFLSPPTLFVKRKKEMQLEQSPIERITENDIIEAALGNYQAFSNAKLLALKHRFLGLNDEITAEKIALFLEEKSKKVNNESGSA
jgi:hypothetical protein